MGILTTILLLLSVVFIVGIVLMNILKSPFEYPYYIYEFDVTGKRSPNIEDLIDRFLINDGLTKIQHYNEIIKRWKVECEEELKHCWLKKYRVNQYLECLDDSHAFEFRMIRYQTRYKQVNYIKIPYKVPQIVKETSFDYDYLLKRDKKLQAIGYECTLNEYHSKNQRRLLTNELRQEITIRDNYTCQICGKYMPDGVGLQIDHKVPVSKGGKTVRSNLQVLCSKCNGSKSDKTSSL